MNAAPTDRLLQSGIRISIVGAAWTLVMSTIAIWIGLASDGLALIAFGAVGILDAAGSTTLAVHFRLARVDAAGADHAERAAFRVITAGLVAVGVTTAAASVLHLVDHEGSEETAAGVAIAGLSLAALTALALRKRWLGRRIPSRGLLADGHLSAVGAALAGVTLLGTVVTGSFGWWWADSVAALVVAVVAARLGVELARQPPPPD